MVGMPFRLLPELAETNISPGQMSDQFKFTAKSFYDAA